MLWQGRSLVATIAWPLAALGLLYHLFQATGETGVDLRPVWIGVDNFLRGDDPYVDRYFVYPPSALLLLSPLGLVDFQEAKAIFAVGGTLAVVAAAALCLRLFEVDWRSPASALLALGLTMLGPAWSTVGNGNVNSLVLLGAVAGLLAASRERWTAAGVWLGATLALKPILAPVLVLLVLERRWRPIVVAAALAAAVGGLALLLARNDGHYFSDVVPFLFQGESQAIQPFNVSLAAAAETFGLPRVLSLAARALVVCTGAVFLWRRAQVDIGPAPRDRALRLIELYAIAMLVSFLTFSFAWPYYSLLLLPLFVSVIHERSVMRHWLPWVGVYCAASPDVWTSDRLPRLLDQAAGYRTTLGFLLLLLSLGMRRGYEGPALRATATS